MKEQKVQIGEKCWVVGRRAIRRVIALLNQVGACCPADSSVADSSASASAERDNESRSDTDATKKQDVAAKPKRNTR